MNRRTKIIVSVAGIFIVMLALLELTYAYFLTKINPNKNPKSISVTTAKLSLEYGDGNGKISANNIMPGTTITSKEFTITNNGNVTLDYIVDLENIIYTFTRQNEIKPNVTHKYTLTLRYENSDEDQSEDMGKELSAKINIKMLEMNRENTLQYVIINNAKNNANGTRLMAQPLTIPAQEIRLESEKILAIAPDDYGYSYYYRGSVENNYLKLNNMCFRIIRIEGDGSIKITLAKEGTCSSITESDTKSALINNSSKNSYGFKDSEEINIGGSFNSYGMFDYEGAEGELHTKLSEWFNSKFKVNDQLVGIGKKLKNEDVFDVNPK